MKDKEAYFYNIPCFFNEENNSLRGRNIFYNLLLTMMIFIHLNFIVFITCSFNFPIKIRRDNER